MAEAICGNIVRMEDGKNYLADVTNCDGTKGGTISGQGFRNKLFLAGVSGTVSTGYLASLTTYYGSSREITYLYDTKTGSLYDTDVLTLSSANYTVPAATKNITDSMVALFGRCKRIRRKRNRTDSVNCSNRWRYYFKE